MGQQAWGQPTLAWGPIHLPLLSLTETPMHPGPWGFGGEALPHCYLVLGRG